MSDPLAQFRKKPIGGAHAPTTPKEPDGYLAFAAKDKVDRLKIRRASAQTRSPSYAWLLDVTYDGEHGLNFALVYSFMMVLVRGRNLQPVVTALQMGTADFIQEFDADRWAKPKDEAAPFIESIQVVVQEHAPTIEDSEDGRQVH